MQKILILCAEKDWENALRQILPDFEIEAISGFAFTRPIEACWERISKSKFDVLILTNLGISAYDVIEYVRRLPEKRGYRAVVMTGCMTMELADICNGKGVSLAKLPLGREEMRALISGEWGNR